MRNTPIRRPIFAILTLVLLGLATAERCLAQVVISEFMAKNDETLIDGDGNYSDWIELYNLGDTAADLTGWYLSDDATNLVKWQFPSKNIAADEFLVVFASNQDTADYVDSLGHLHTTFKLSGDGEDVVLTQSDGVTVADAFYDYPEQDDDVSYGLYQDASYSYLIAEGEDATALVGTSEPPASWNTVGFDDSGWQSGQTGVGYDEGSTYTSEIGLDLEGTMFIDGRPPTFHDTAYIRVEFDVADAAVLSHLALRMKYDDGFVAYINGEEVASANAPASPTHASEATEEHDGTSYEDYTLANAGNYLQTGRNVLAIQGLAHRFDPRQSSGHPDFFIMPALNGVSAGTIHTNTTVYLDAPTPGADNVEGVQGYVGDTTFSVDRGFYTAATNVEIFCKTEGAEIYFTTDGTAPSPTNGILYSGTPITIDKTTVLRAAAFLDGYQPSDVDTQTYIFLDDIIAQGTSVSGLDPYFPPSSVNGQGFDYGMDTDITQSATYSGEMETALLSIPSISLVTDPANLFDAGSGIYVNADNEGELWERPTSIELINPDGSRGFQINGGMRIRGASSTMASNPKHSFRLFFRSEYGAARLNYDLFGGIGADSFKRMDLRTGQNFSWAHQTPQYATWLYDIFTRDTHRDIDQPYTAGEYYHLYINGMYWGLYQTEERCDSRYAESYYGDDDSDFDAVKADADTGVMYAVDGTRDAYDELWSAANSGFGSDAAYFAAQGMNADGTENSSYDRLLDVDNVIDYMLLVYFTANRDSPIGPPHQATKPRNLNAIYNRAHPDGFKFVAHDNEHSLEISEGVYHNRFNQSLGYAFNSNDFFTPWWLHLKLMENDEYKMRFADHVHEHFFNGGALTADVTANRLQARREEIDSAVVAESARWGDSAGTLRTRNDDWLTCVNWLLNTYMASRSDIVHGQIVAEGWYPTVAAPEFNQHGGSIASGFPLSISGTGSVYYTLDGSDPRAVGGGMSGTEYSSPMTVYHSAQVQARALNGGTWSALTKATFVVDEPSPVRVTEIMYNPAGPVSGTETDYCASDFEFIEVLNTSSETIGLAGTEFTEGIRFDFTEGDVRTLGPGEYAVLVSNLGAFKTRYADWGSMNIAGTYHGKFFIPTAALSNSGEVIALVDGLGRTVVDFEYDDWYEAADGEGFSLTLIDPTVETDALSDSTAWRPSRYSGGTPGEGPYDFLLPDDLVINEVLTHQDEDDPGDWVEIYNASSNSIDINGWYLSDDDTNLMKVALSGLSTIPAGGYLVLTEHDHFGTVAAGANGFAFSELGDGVYLSSAEDGVLTGYRVEEDFAGADRDVTFGRYVKSDGGIDFPAQASATYGGSNGYPRVGAIVISEIHYQPAEGNGYEFIELYNAASTNVPLHRLANPADVWRLDGGVAFSFPTGQVMTAGSYLVISETDAAAFASAYTVPSGVTVLGPYDGKLNNGGESVRVERPGDPEAGTGEIPEILVERVVYDDAEPWPSEAAGGGFSLRRLKVYEYGNDSVNWIRSSGAPTPGAGDTSLVTDYAEMTVAGTFNGWDAGGANMTLVDHYTWAGAASFTEETGVAFKFVAENNWDNSWGDNAPAGAALPLGGTGDLLGSEIVVDETLNGQYTFTFNERTLAYGVEQTGVADADGDGLPDSWEILYFTATNAANGGPEEDWDGDGASNYSEWRAGTDPTETDSLFRILSISPGSSYVLQWTSVTGKVYSVWVSSDLVSGEFAVCQSGIAATPPVNEFTTTPGGESSSVYQVRVEDD